MPRLKIKLKTISKKAAIGAILTLLFSFSFIDLNKAQAKEITAAAVIELVNEARSEANVPILTLNTMLRDAAEKKAQDMINGNYFAHISPEGRSPWDFISQAGYDYRFAGENLAINYTEAKEQQKAWMDSPLHRKNILNPDYQEIGVAVLRGTMEGEKTIVTVQEFGAPMINPVPREIIPNKNEVAGAAVIIPSDPAVKVLATLSEDISKQISLGEVYKDNKLTLAGWSIIFIFGIFLTSLDLIVLFYKNHKQIFTYHSTNKLN